MLLIGPATHTISLMDVSFNLSGCIISQSHTSHSQELGNSFSLFSLSLVSRMLTSPAFSPFK